MVVFFQRKIASLYFVENYFVLYYFCIVIRKVTIISEDNMRKSLFIIFFLFAGIISAVTENRVPLDIYAEGGDHHVQGIAFDREKGCMYFSFTTQFVKTDLNGNVLGTIDKIQGHLGAMVFNPEGRKVYASLECKDDQIGAELSTFAKGHSLFHIAIIDVDKVTSIGMDSEDNEAFQVVCIREAGKDYAAKVIVDGKTLEHRYGCSGIDGITIAPKLGRSRGKNYLYVAYGIYGDTTRTDNDNQVLLRYRFGQLRKYARTVRFGTFSESGPAKPDKKIFIPTGNTTYGIQNMTYDSGSCCLFLAVYPGEKSHLPNYSTFTVDFRNGKIRGSHFKWGTTGISPVGNGLWYISENGTLNGKQNSHAHLYRWTDIPEDPFERQ